MNQRIIMKSETKLNLIIAGWFLAVFLAIAGVMTWYSTNPTITGLIVAVILMGGFLFSLKAASAFLFDNRNTFGLRMISLVFLVGLVSVDVFSGSHSLQTGTMKRIVKETQGGSMYQSALSTVESLQAQLDSCPPNYYKNCKLPLSERLSAAQERLAQASGNNIGSAEAKFWQALTNAINGMTENQVKIEDVVFYTYVFIMILASCFTIYAFGILGSARTVDDELPDDPKPTGTDDRSTKKTDKKSFGFIPNATPATASSDTPKAKSEDEYPFLMCQNIAVAEHAAKKKEKTLSASERQASKPTREPFKGVAYQENGVQHTPIRDDNGRVIGQKSQQATAKTDKQGSLSASNKPQSPNKQAINKPAAYDLDQQTFLKIRSAILSGDAEPTFPKLQTWQQDNGIGKSNTERRYYSTTTMEKMVGMGEMVINPEWTSPRCGRAKYLLNENQRLKKVG